MNWATKTGSDKCSSQPPFHDYYFDFRYPYSRPQSPGRPLPQSMHLAVDPRTRSLTVLPASSSENAGRLPFMEGPGVASPLLLLPLLLLTASSLLLLLFDCCLEAAAHLLLGLV